VDFCVPANCSRGTVAQALGAVQGAALRIHPSERVKDVPNMKSLNFIDNAKRSPPLVHLLGPNKLASRYGEPLPDVEMG
jgi:hypothetical protein